jgi:hypothetical protein
MTNSVDETATGTHFSPKMMNYADKLVSEHGNQFVQVESGHFAQTNPQPVVLTEEFQLGVDQLTKDVLSEISKVGSSGSKYR